MIKRSYPILESSYIWESRKEEKLKRKLLKNIKKERLPKALEISLVEDILKYLKASPEHDYNNRYDTFKSQHPSFF